MKVRVKMCGKSTQARLVIAWWGKPCLEQDKIGAYGRLFRFKRTGMSLRYMVATYKVTFVRTESGLPFYCG